MVIKRVGGKAKLANWIKAHIPSGNPFVDVFGGSGAVLDVMLGQDIVYVFNDLDAKIHNFFKVMQNKGHELAHFIDLTPYGRQVFNESCDIMEGEKYNTLSDVEKAAVFLIANRQSFSATMRKPWSITRDGEVNYKTWSKLPKYIMQTKQKWKGVFLENADYRQILEKWDSKKTVFYIDPPYEGVEGRYYDVNRKIGFDHSELQHILSKIQGSYCVSYYGDIDANNDPMLLKTYCDQGDEIVRKSVYKHMTVASKKIPATEVLIIKNNKWSREHNIAKAIKGQVVGDMFL